MIVSIQTRALLLLTADLGGEAPLDAQSFDRLASWLRKRGLQPADLLKPEAARHLAKHPAGPTLAARVLSLLDRESELIAALERWQAAGLWILGRGDPDYPRRLKRRLRNAAPALLFGCGDQALLNRGGIAVIGGDGGGAEPAEFAAGFATTAASSGLTAIAGGTGSIEAAALRAGLSRGGTAIAVLPDRLMKEVGSDRLPQPAAGGLLVFVSTAAPDAEAVVASRRASDDCLYALADAALLVAVGRADAGWAGAISASERGWLPLWVRRGDPEAGELARLGARLLPSDTVSPRTLLDPAMAPERSGSKPSPARPTAFMTPAPGPSLIGFAEERAPFGGDGGLVSRPPGPSSAPAGERGGHLRLVASTMSSQAEAAHEAPVEPALYDIFVQRVTALLRTERLGIWRIANVFDLTEQQAEAWLRRAEAAGLVGLDPVTRLYRNDTRA